MDNSTFIQHRHTDKEHVFYVLVSPCGSSHGMIRISPSDCPEERKTDIIISHVSVSDSERGKGWGNAVLSALEAIAIENGASEVFLFVDEHSWMQKWYERKGYSYWAENAEEPGTVWMRKELVKKEQ